MHKSSYMDNSLTLSFIAMTINVGPKLLGGLRRLQLTMFSYKPHNDLKSVYYSIFSPAHAHFVLPYGDT